MKLSLSDRKIKSRHGSVRLTLVRVLLVICLLGGTAQYFRAGDSDRLADLARSVAALFDSSVDGAGASSYHYQNIDLVGRITHVKDGDSLILAVDGRDVEIRLHGVDAPEWKQPHGEAAKRALRKMVLRRQVGVEAVTVDSYGRTVGTLFLEERNINLEMVRTGNAWWYRRYASADKALQRAEMQAKSERIGLWRGADPVPPWDWRQSR